jgi:hypothetical protein
MTPDPLHELIVSDGPVVTVRRTQQWRTLRYVSASTSACSGHEGNLPTHVPIGQRIEMGCSAAKNKRSLLGVTEGPEGEASTGTEALEKAGRCCIL